MDKAITLEGDDRPDSLVFDLEDSIDPEYKDEARKNLEKRLAPGSPYRRELDSRYPVTIVRVNHEGTPWFERDMKSVARIKPDAVMLAKVGDSHEIERVRDFLKSEKCTQQLIAPIETVAGFKKRESILDALTSQDLFLIGYEDLSGELNIDRPEDLESANPITHMLMESLIEAQQRKIVMWDAVSRKFTTEENLRMLAKECYFARRIGLQGKIAIHPSQVGTINRKFNKNDLVQRARDTIARFRKKIDGTWVIKNEQGEMEDTPSLNRALRTLEFWERI